MGTYNNPCIDKMSYESILIFIKEERQYEMKKSTLILSLIVTIVLLMAGCSAAVAANNTAEPAPAETTPAATSMPMETAPAVTSAPTETVPVETSTPTENESATDIAQETKEFLLSGQEDKPEAGRLHWSEEFLNKVDINAVYEEYLSSGGKADDVISFAEYLTLNAPISQDWKTMFEADLLEQYESEVVRYEDLGNGIYQAYVMIDGSEVPYVAVNARTGYYHG